jgi:hypothetical protein
MFNEFFEVLKENHFVEKPVDAKTFVESPDYLGQPTLSDIQYDIVEAMSQIYRKEDLEELYGSVEGAKYFNKYTKNEIILQLGKGSGKDFVSTVACAYTVYKLLCLKDPAIYYGKPAGDAIDIINVAINAQQAKNVFFKGFKSKIERSPWFAGKYNAKADSIDFDKSVTVYSGHSERESHEGLNLFMAVLDEISGFASEVGTGNEQGKTAENIYKAFRGTVDSRFPDLGKVVFFHSPAIKVTLFHKDMNPLLLKKKLLSVNTLLLLTKICHMKTQAMNLKFLGTKTHILSYKIPKVLAFKKPTWEVNPTRKIDDFKIAFYTDLADAMMRFACMPTYSSDSFFKHRKIRKGV